MALIIDIWVRKRLYPESRWKMFPPLLLFVAAITAEAADTLKGDFWNIPDENHHNDQLQQHQVWWSVWTTRNAWARTESALSMAAIQAIQTILGWAISHHRHHWHVNRQDYEIPRPNLRMGKCVCKQGFIRVGENFSCQRESKLIWQRRRICENRAVFVLCNKPS